MFVEAFADEAVDKVGEACGVELAAVLAVVFHQHGEGGPEGLEEVVCMDVGTADGLEGVEVDAELEGEAGGVDVAETTGGGGVVEAATEYAGVEVVVGAEAEGEVEVL